MNRPKTLIAVCLFLPAMYSFAYAALIHGEAWLSIILPVEMYVTVTLADPNGTIINEGLFTLTAIDFMYPTTPYGGGGIKVGNEPNQIYWVKWVMKSKGIVNYEEFVNASNSSGADR